MADLSFSFDPDKGSKASSKILAQSSAWEAGSASAASSDAASKVAVGLATATSRISALSATAASAASDAASAAVQAAASSYIKSLPGVGSRAVHEIVMTSAGLIKYIYSSVAA